MQGAVTLVTMAVPIIFSLLALLRVEHFQSTQQARLHQDRGIVEQQTALLDEGQALSLPRETVQASPVQLCPETFLMQRNIENQTPAEHQVNTHSEVAGIMRTQ